MPATERIDLRIDSASKKKVDRFSKRQKISSSQFIKTAIEYYMRYLEVKESETITLSREEFSILSKLIATEEEPNKKLTKAAEEYRRFTLRKSKPLKNDH
ncbi:MAG: DUF1778 domain-containing protein [Ignavibacteria bacterium]|nr:DUF1778 domain-containing protein [Ignavibacteria bacterium]